MKKIVYTCVFLTACQSSTTDVEISDASAEDEITHELCCKITKNDTDSWLWNNRTYTCVQPDAQLDPFNPPWLCNVSEAGECGSGSTYECHTCFESCVAGMNCLGVNGTGIVVTCD